MKTRKLFLGIAAITLASNLTAQTTGSIKGAAKDEKGEGIPFAKVALMENSKIINGVDTDEKGDFTFKYVIPGVYTLQFSSMGFQILTIADIEVNENETALVYKTLKTKITDLGTIVVEGVVEKWEKPVLDPTYSTITKLDINQIENAAVGKANIIGLITMVSPAVIATNDGKDLYVRGSRRGTTAYYVDGNRMLNGPEVPGLSISGMEVLTGGMPAEYGDCTGGLVIITTKEYKLEMRRKQMEKSAREERK